MPNSVDFSGKPFHFIGIGGIGMSALAYILAKRQLPVYGSDVRSNHITQRLQELGAHIFWNQEASNLEQFQHLDWPRTPPSPAANGIAQVAIAAHTTPKAPPASPKPTPDHWPQVICSSAISRNNAEYRAAVDLGCPIFHRSDLLAALMEEYQSIAIAGTHGKTTTSSMLGFLLLHGGLDPTIVVGGEVEAWEGNARMGQGPYLVAEADESDGSLVKFQPKIGVVTNIELDHPDRYANLDEVVETFSTFAGRCETVIGSLDCTVVREQLQPHIGYSLDLDSGADYRVDGVSYGADGTTARVWERDQVLGTLQLKLLGKHNLSNALAAIAVGRLLGLEFEVIAKALWAFEGARRRFESRGLANGILFVDDYAHHPSEVRATLAAAGLQRRPGKYQRVVAIFQPHRHSRTQTFLSEFAQSFGDADAVVVSDVYGVGESQFETIGGDRVAEAISAHHRQVHYHPTLEQVTAFLKQALRPGDLAVFLGAGNLNQIIPDVVTFHQKVEHSGAR